MRIFDICRQLTATLDKGHLPGSEAHLKMAPPAHTALPYSVHTKNSSSSLREAAVLILISPPEEAPRIPLIIRADDGGAHSGQIAMPGGCREDGEAFPVETALREAQEEICLDPGLVKILGLLTPLFIPVSNFEVTPVVAYVEQSVELR